MLSRRVWALALAAIAVITAALLAWREAWICDDALITFRYVRNWVAGDGLVFNGGERVEGFSNFVLVLLLAPFEALQLDLGDITAVIGILATAVETALLVWLLYRREAPVLAIGVVAMLFATDRITAVWATGGLETALHGALITSVLAMQLVRPTSIRVLAVLHGLLAASRPEGIIFFPLWLAHLVITKRTGDVRRALNVFVPVLVILLAARLLYYGELVANPYRAKVEGVPTFEFGAGYTLWFLKRIGLFGLTALATVPLIVCAVRGWRAAPRFHAPLALAAGFVVAQLVAITASGGDYMCDFRLYRPILGPLYIALGCLIAIAWQRPPRVVTAIAVVALVASHGYRQLEPVQIFDDAPPPAAHQRILTIAAERPMEFARALSTFAKPGDSVLADWAGYMGYGHDLRTIDATGLLSKHLARDFYLRPERAEDGLRERLPGHARWPTIEMMQREQLTFIFPKLNERPAEDAEIDERTPRRRRDYPFLHVTVPLAGGRFLRFFTTLDANQIAERARDKRIRACFRPAFGALTCVDGTRE